jgi:hypothetical protein
VNDLEERLRADLWEATGSIRLEPDLDAIVSDGDRVIRSRRVRGVVVGVAALVVAAGVGWAGLGYQTSGGGSPVLATPAPVSSPPVVATTGTHDSVSSTSGDLPAGSGATGFTVDATLTGPGRYEVTFQAMLGNGRTAVQGPVRVGADDQEVHWMSVGRILIGFVPHRFDWIQYVDRNPAGVFGSFSSGERRFGRLNATVVWRVSDKAGTYEGLRGYIWGADGGVIRDSLGTVLPNETLTLPRSGIAATFYVDEALDVLACRQNGNAGSASVKSNRVQITFTSATAPGGLASGGVILPRGASDPRLTSSGSELESRQTRIDGRLVILVSARMATDTEPVLSSISYTDASGTRVTKQL